MEVNLHTLDLQKSNCFQIQTNTKIINKKLLLLHKKKKKIEKFTLHSKLLMIIGTRLYSTVRVHTD